MAILQTCCCRYTIRQGSFGAAIYTLVYFLLFALLTGNYSYNEVVGRSYTQPSPLPPLPHSPINSTNSTSNNGGITTEMTTAIPTSDMVLICVDFFCEICGFVASILLLRGLLCNRRCYLIPWLVVVPLHTLIDTFTVINIIILYLEHSSSGESDWWGLVTSVTVILDFLLNFINVYAFLCVLSQYQEYVAGRGSAAYGFPWEGQPSVQYQVGGESGGGGHSSGQDESESHHDGHCSNRHRPNWGNAYFSTDVGEKSDVWCQDLVLDKLDNNSLELNTTTTTTIASTANTTSTTTGDSSSCGCDGWGQRRYKNSRKHSNANSVRFDIEEISTNSEQSGNNLGR